MKNKGNFQLSPHLPLIVAEWPRNKREVIRISFSEYSGRKTIDVRVWWFDDDEVLKPGRTGITLAIKHLPQIAEGIGKALAQATELGLLLEEAGQ